MSDTPRSEAAKRYIAHHSNDWWVRLSVAEQLERELTASKDENQRLRDYIAIVEHRAESWRQLVEGR